MTDNTPNNRGFKLENNTIFGCNGIGFKNLLTAGSQWLEAHAAHVNRSNVFPVPDGDTGTNMVLTMRAAVAQTEHTAGNAAGDVAAAAAYGALMGARGNSGVILSQYLQGLANGLRDSVCFYTDDFARAAQFGAQLAYQSVAEPVEGTMLTVAQAVSRAAAASAQSTRDLAAQFTHIVNAARLALASTPELLPVLKHAGVTDSGGQGLLYILEGWLRFLRHQPLDAVGDSMAVGAGRPQLPAADNYGFDVQFLVTGRELNVAEIRNAINGLGWSTMVAGSEQVVKVHLHTHNPNVPLGYGANLGTISDVVVENLTAQVRGFFAGLKPVSTTAVGTVLLAPGPGFEQIFLGLGANAVLTGPAELRQAIEQIPYENVLIFPNNGKLILAAQQAAQALPKNVWVVPSQTAPQGIAGLLAIDPQLDDLPENAARATAALAGVSTITVAENGFGTVTAACDGYPPATGHNAADVVLELLARVKNNTHELVSIYFGADASQQLAQNLARTMAEHQPELEIEIYNGGQPHHKFIIALE